MPIGGIGTTMRRARELYRLRRHDYLEQHDMQPRERRLRRHRQSWNTGVDIRQLQTFVTYRRIGTHDRTRRENARGGAVHRV